MSASAVAELRTAFDEPFLALGLDPTRDRATVVVSWPSIPVEIIHAAGLSAVFARGSAAATPLADRVLEPDLFPNRLRHLVEAALAGRLTDVAAVLLPRSSDPDYKCFLYLRELARRGLATALPPVLLFDLLHADSPDALAYNAERTRSLTAKIAELAGRRVGREDLRSACEAANRARASARRIAALRSGAPRLDGREALPLLGAFWQLAPERYTALANAAAEAAARRPPLDGPRVLIAGVPVDGTALHDALGAAGGVVVAELTPFGSCGTSSDVELGEDPAFALAEHCRRESIDARTPVKTLMRKLDELLDGVSAVVVSLPTEDASFGWDYPRIRELLAERAIPHVVLDGDPARAATAADTERIRALLGRALRETGGG